MRMRMRISIILRTLISFFIETTRENCAYLPAYTQTNIASYGEEEDSTHLTPRNAPSYCNASAFYQRWLLDPTLQE
jgi:hypothetical protein